MVLAFEDDRQALGLDRRHRGIAEGVQVRQHGGGQRQSGKGGGFGGHEAGLRCEAKNAAQSTSLEAIRPTTPCVDPDDGPAFRL